jgi:ethanolamine transporter EutH
VLDVHFQGGFSALLAGEAVPVGERYLVLGHVIGVVAVPVGRVEGGLVLVLLLPSVEEVRRHLAGRDVDDQDVLAAAVGRRELEVNAAHGGLQMHAQPLAQLLVIDLVQVDALHVCGVADAVDEETGAPRTCPVDHGCGLSDMMPG